MNMLRIIHINDLDGGSSYNPFGCNSLVNTRLEGNILTCIWCHELNPCGIHNQKEAQKIINGAQGEIEGAITHF